MSNTATAHVLAPLALSQFTTGNQPFRADLDLMQRCGWRTIEMCESKLSKVSHDADDELKALRDSGLRVCSVQAAVHAVFPDQMSAAPEDPGRRADAFCRSMDRFIEALPDQRPTFVLISGRAPDHDLARARETLLTQATRLADEAGQRDCRIAFEALNPMMINEDTFLTAWDEALSLVEAVDSPTFGLVCDLWNVWQQPGIEADVLGSADRLLVVHVSDWRDGGPRRLNDRLVPGEGVIPFASWGRTLRAAGYAGPICLEMLSDPDLADSYYHRDFAEVLDASQQALDAAGWWAE